MKKVCRSITKALVMSLGISMAFSFSSLAAGRLEIRAKPGSSVHLYRAGMVDANGKASVYDWYSDVDDVSELSDEELAGMISSHFNERYADKVGTYRVGSDGSVVFNDIMDAVYYVRSDGMDPAAVILPGTDARTGKLSYDVTVAIGDTALPETEASAVEPKAAESEAAAESKAAESEAAVESKAAESEAAAESKAAESEVIVEPKAAESEAAAESKAAESEAAVETSGMSTPSEEQGTDVSEETSMTSKPETAPQESASAVQDKSEATENETTAPHTAGKIAIAALLMALAVAAVTAVSRIRRKRTIETRRAAREARYRAWKENQDAEEEIEDSKDRV